MYEIIGPRRIFGIQACSRIRSQGMITERTNECHYNIAGQGRCDQC